MFDDIVTEVLDMRAVQWSTTKETSGSAGMFLKTRVEEEDSTKYFKLGFFSEGRGFIGHECILEITAQRVLQWCGYNVLKQVIAPVQVCINGYEYLTQVIISSEYRKANERRIPMEVFCSLRNNGTPIDFLLNSEFRNEVLEMLVADYIIYNRDRHGCNAEFLLDIATDTYRMAPLFDHGCCLDQPAFDDWKVRGLDYFLGDTVVNNYLGNKTLLSNLRCYCKGNIQLRNLYLPVNILKGLSAFDNTNHIEFLRKILTARYQKAVRILNYGED